MDPLKLHVERLPAGPSLEEGIAAVARRTDPAILENPDPATGRRRYTILAYSPLDVMASEPGAGDPFECLRKRLGDNSFTSTSGRSATSRERDENANLPFCGGWIGYFAYEAGHFIEKMAGHPACDISLPIARWGLYDSAAVHDGFTNQWTLSAADLRDKVNDARKPVKAIAGWKHLLDNVRQWSPQPPPTAPEPIENMSYPDYLDRVRRAKEYIAAGDIFQVNLARRFTLRQSEPALETWLRLRRYNPAPYAAFLSWDEGRSAILSASPELFLSLRDRQIVTRPIKGTRPRSADPIVDASYQQALLASGKDHAELAMIVDLERNDLGRVCEYGSIQVLTRGSNLGASDSEFAQLESHPSVHHLVATVSGRLRQGCDAIDLLRATFPGGSITGAPKVRAMQIIDELEPTHRSVYTGAIGHIGFDGSMTLNIAIRTLIVDGGRAHGYVGSGIVADSQPEDEYAETTAKAVGLCRALGVAIGPDAQARGSSVVHHVDDDAYRA